LGRAIRTEPIRSRGTRALVITTFIGTLAIVIRATRKARRTIIAAVFPAVISAVISASIGARALLIPLAIKARARAITASIGTIA
jgi:hypothetical protein